VRTGRNDRPFRLFDLSRMAIAYTDIARVLDGARRRQGWIVLATALGWGTASALVAVLAGVAALGAGLAAGPVRHATLAAAVIAALCALAWAAAALARRASSPESVARTVGRAAPDLHSDLVSSVELEGEYGDLVESRRFSIALVDAHIARTAARARGLDLAVVVPSRPARRAAAAAAVAIALHLAALAVWPRAMWAGWLRLAGAGPAATVRRAEPITGDVELTYVFPAYMKRAPQTISGTGGEVNAPKGTEVRLKTRADRPVEGAEIALEMGSAGGRPSTAAPVAEPSEARSARGAEPKGDGRSPGKVFGLAVANGRDLEGRFVVEEGGSYRFRFTRGKKVMAEGPAIPIVVEADAFPEVRITAPADEVEVGADANLRVEWIASDDVGLRDLALVVKPPEGEERRTVLRQFDGSRRESGVHDLALAPLKLGEGERVLYWLEATDGDTVSGPKRSASSTHTIKIYSEAEHHRAAMAKAQQLWEEMVRVLGDRLELLDGHPRWTPDRVLQGQALDARTRALHEGMREAASQLRREKSAPKELSTALANAAAGIRQIEPMLSAVRNQLGRQLAYVNPQGSSLVQSVGRLDGQLDAELEKDVLYLEELFDKRRAEDLVRMGKDLAQRRRDLASLMEKYKDAPTDAKKKELLAEVARLKARMREMMQRMAELAKGLADEHMNQEALAELQKSNDAMGGLDDVEKKLAQGDIEGAMKALDQLGSAMQQMLAGLERTAGAPDQKNAELMKEMLAFKKDLEEVQGEQEKVAGETEAMKQAYQKRVAEKLKEAEQKAKKLEAMAEEARREVGRAEPGVNLRSEEDFAQSRDRLSDLQKALAARDFDAALESVKRALPPMQRLALGLGDEADMTERYRALGTKDPKDLREAQRHAAGAIGPARKVQEELEKLFPDPKSVLGDKEQQRLGQLEQQQGALERKAGALRRKLEELAQRAPIFPPQSRDMLAGSQGHMLQAQNDLGRKDPQRGHGEQRQALDDLGRFKKGLDEMAKNARGGGQGGAGFPFPFGADEPGQRDGDGQDPSRERVEIPGAEAYKVPEEFRKDLLEAMKQGAPEPYKGDLQRYYEELVK
jgi:hypothetical protein